MRRVRGSRKREVRGLDRKRRNKGTGEGSDGSEESGKMAEGDNRRNNHTTYDCPAHNTALQTIRALCFTPSSPSPSHPILMLVKKNSILWHLMVFSQHFKIEMLEKDLQNS